MGLLLTALALVAASGLPSVCAARRSAAAARIGYALLLAGSACGIYEALAVLLAAPSREYVLGLPLPVGNFQLVLDRLAAFFLLPIFVVGAAGATYALRYWDAGERPRSGPHVRLFYGWLMASMGLVVLAGDGVGFLLAWELVSLAAFAAIAADDQRKSVRQAAWLYLVNAHLSMLLLFAMFALWNAATGSFAFHPLHNLDAGSGYRAPIFLLALLGFGSKAGMMPLHFWLPAAHANAPSHVSALLSGVVIKLGIYGLVRVGLILLPDPPLSWGVLVLLAGVISAILGVVFALSQHDLKRLLAYHSIENIGIILMGLGVAMIGAYARKPAWIVLGTAGCLLHVWNHGLFKSLLFLAAGSVIKESHTHDIDRLGGRAKMMPFTAGAFVLGAIAICGLPPLNGFVSEWLVYLGLLGPLSGEAPRESAVLALAAPALALVGALAVACFVKVYGIVFLGTPRTRPASRREAPVSMLLPMAVLGAACLLIGIVPSLAIGAVSPAISQSTGIAAADISSAVAPVGPLSLWMPVLAAALLVIGFSYKCLAHGRTAAAGTWDCGYARPSPRMQYSASSFAASILEMFRWVLRPKVASVRLAQLFPPAARFTSHVGDVVLDGCLIPMWTGFKNLLVRRRAAPQGNLQWYLISICLTLFGLLLSLLPWQQVWNWLLSRG